MRSWNWVLPVLLGVTLACGASGGAGSGNVNADISAADAMEDFQPFDEPPTVDRMVEPDYPEYAKQNQIEGLVQLRVNVSAGGKVESARVMESTNPIFDEPALAAVRQWRFKPARKDGETVRSQVMVPVKFRL
ncbi:MAG TPA: energy transducer TonB [Candidatus Krumholzibacteria bacterium]|nr:energy transducer TonB [Candidatus Krumholzibacteria bacterium]